jgi:acyl-CoA synthetase (AMP-forming)/AMP-acid ligase II
MRARPDWKLPETTAKEFQDGWFKTGDTGLRSSTADGAYRILGRTSVDMIKVRLRDRGSEPADG